MAYKKGNLAMLISGSIVMIGLLLLSSWMIPILFGKEYQDSVVLTNILALSIPIYFVAYSVGATLVTRKNMQLKVKFMGTTALLNIILNIILIPLYSAKGAAIATLISNLFLLILYYIGSQKRVFKMKIMGNYVAAD
jgi:O-antigen/teichoic acid export membrane protein